jgi:hypothetical protein
LAALVISLITARAFASRPWGSLVALSIHRSHSARRRVSK